MTRKNYSVSVRIDSDLYRFLEQNRNNSKFFVEAAEAKLNTPDEDTSLLGMVKSLIKEVAEIKKVISSGVKVNARRSIGDNRPEIRRGRR